MKNFFVLALIFTFFAANHAAASSLWNAQPGATKTSQPKPTVRVENAKGSDTSKAQIFNNAPKQKNTTFSSNGDSSKKTNYFNAASTSLGAYNGNAGGAKSANSYTTMASPTASSVGKKEPTNASEVFSLTKEETAVLVEVIKSASIAKANGGGLSGWFQGQKDALLGQLRDRVEEEAINYISDQLAGVKADPAEGVKADPPGQ